MQDINNFSMGNASAFLINEASKIPKNAFILTQNTLMPYFSNDINTYSTPWSPGIYNNLSEFTYIIFQYNSYWATTTQSTPSLQTIAINSLSNGTYSIIASLPSSGIYVLEKNWNGVIIVNNNKLWKQDNFYILIIFISLSDEMYMPVVENSVPIFNIFSFNLS